MTALLKILMQHPGKVLNREALFRKVWQTDYVGDTRTLDTHISWLRKKIEANPKEPVVLKTVRGVGYRLEM
jgi:DNA-binding response OmpR family regulator